MQSVRENGGNTQEAFDLEAFLANTSREEWNEFIRQALSGRISGKSEDFCGICSHSGDIHMPVSGKISAIPKEVAYMLIFIPSASLVCCFLVMEVAEELISVWTVILCICIIGAIVITNYIKLSESIADKEFHYTDYISKDILKQSGLVNEIAEQMLGVIRDMGFGDALRELMSNRVCNYSVNVLKNITGLDNNTIEKMWNDKSLTKVNVVSACLGLHLPFPVSSTLVEAVDLTINMFVGSANAKAENRSY